MSHSHLFLKSAFVKAPIQNGLGRYVCQLQRITVKFCKEHSDSKGARDFIENHVIDFAKKNPGIVVYLKPRRHRAPHIKLEYLNGETEILGIKCMSEHEVAQWLEVARGSSGQPVARLRKLQHTDHPSIQGVWTPWTNVPPQANVETFPSEAYRAPQREQSATERLQEIFRRQQQEQQQQQQAEPA
ncbi:39S ribosomal protein L43, mitochondrial-like [Pollicipes pollicipes]|uniref:39S ribosomal protein L43, mitochondrial-like n=1 Tax=Pollicipes pollicipes TaxID=41117 RepID=UPI0018849A85|nr:39S ribosomal protein L43, mitochondrial-like [Pollicipes pollicipes]XP_037081454.1 39S ribosomal protein L43, mitochondrial-like [Pollicipes pollicipes]XP_037081455.1 39S ribosomal protein L43, mitochondrial-like [Pollicipes pollicipes]XP_037081456.1 39S ribosomal protein L43, mitochondrial-like [Pollicipes pollicipes]XP_037081457.1 39S ribosomal protein L43, mitochondrial-like [Pollicipes pollicipes]